MRNDFYYPSSDGRTRIHAVEWIPEGDVKAVLQISHGMVEFIMRYKEFAEYLNQYGIYVTGNDHLGHGESVVNDEDHGYFHQPDGNECVINDIHKLRCITSDKYPDIPYFILGHSMGSFLARQYVMIHGEGLSGAIIMGTGSTPAPVLETGMLLCRSLAAVHGWHYRSDLVNRIVSSSNNKRFEPVRTPADWLTKDEEIVDTYLKNPWCTFVFTLNGFHEMLRGIRYIQKPNYINMIPKGLPLLFVSGKEDPIGNYGKGVKKAYRACRKAGVKDVHIRLYPNDRHEILNETDREKVYKDLRIWMQKNSGR